MAKLKKETAEVEIKLQAEQAKAAIKELTDKSKELTAQLTAMGKDDTGRQAVIDQLNQIDREVITLRQQVKTPMSVIINGEDAEASLKELKLAQIQLSREMATFSDQTDPVYQRLKEKLTEVSTAIVEMEAPIRSARQGLVDLGQDGSALQLETKIKSLKAELSKLSPESDEFKNKLKELGRSEAELDKIAESTRAAKREFQQVGAVGSFTQLQSQAEALRAEIDQLTPGTAAFIAKSKELQQVQGRIERLNREITGTSGVFSRISAEVKQFGALAATYLGFNALTSSIRNIVQKNAELSDAMSAVAKTTGLTDQEVKKLTRSFKEFDTRSSRTELLDLARIAGKLGIEGSENIKGFVKAADQINVALAEDLGGNAEEAIRQVGKLVDIFKVNQKFSMEDAMLKTGSAINALGAASTANEGYLVEFAKRFGGIAPNANISIEDTLGLAAALDQLGQTSEVSTTALGKILVKMGQDVPKFAKLAGISVQEMSQLMATNTNEALLKVLEGAKSSKEGLEGLVETLGDMGVDSARAAGVIGVLSKNIDIVRKQQAIANTEFEKGTSITQEFNRVNSNFAANLEKLGKRIAGIFMNEGVIRFFDRMVTGLNNLLSPQDNYLKKSEEIIKANNLQARSAQKLLDEYNHLTRDGVKPNAEQKERLKIIALQLRDALGESAVSLNKETGEMTVNIERTKELIKQKILLANSEASTLALKADNIKTEQESNKQKAKSLMEELHLRGKILESFGLDKKAAEDYYVSLREGGARAVQTEKFLGEEKLNAINNFINAQRLLSGLTATISNQEKERIKILEKLKELGFKESDVKNLFEGMKPTDAEGNVNATTDTSSINKSVDDFKKKILELNKELANLRIAGIKDEHERSLAALDDRYKNERQKAIDNLKAIRDDENITAQQKEEAAQATNNILLQLESNYREDRQQLIEKYQQALRDKEFKDDTDNLNRWHEEQKLANLKAFNDGLITRAEFQERDKALEEKFLQDKLKLQQDYGKSTLDVEKQIEEGRAKGREKDLQDTIDHEMHLLELRMRAAEDQGVMELSFKQELLQKKFEEDTKYLDKNSEEYKLRQQILNDELLQLDMDFLQHKLGLLQQGYNQIFSIIDNFNTAATNRENTELQKFKKSQEEKKKALKARYDKGLIDKETYDAEVAKLDEQADARERDLKLKQWQRSKETDKSRAIINTLLAITKTLSEYPWPVNAVFAALTAIEGYSKVKAIDSQTPPVMAQGDILPGPSHSEGGMDVIDKRTGKVVANVEGGEAVISKEVVKQNPTVIEALLQAGKPGADKIVPLAVESAPMLQAGGMLPDFEFMLNRLLASVLVSPSIPAPQVIAPDIPSIDTMRIRENIIMQRTGGITAAAPQPAIQAAQAPRQPDSVTPRQPERGEQSSADIVFHLQELKEASDNLKEATEALRNVRAYIVYQDIKDAQRIDADIITAATIAGNPS